MEINDLLVPEGVVADLKATSKKQALQDLAKRAAEVSGLHERAIFDVLMERERLGTTGVGNGIAIPHGKLASLDRLHGLFARLEQPIDFHAIDERPVDLIFVLLAPENAGADHLKALARISRLLRNNGICDKLRGTDSAEIIAARMERARSEISHWDGYDYVVVNDDIEACFAKVKQILASERLRRARQTGLIGFVRGLMEPDDELG